MKRIPLMPTFALLGLAAVIYGFMRPVIQKNAERRSVEARTAEYLAHSKPLVLDAVTQGIFAHADRVEIFRLEDLSDHDEPPSKKSAEIDTLLPIYIQNHRVILTSPVQDKAFAITLSRALTLADSGAAMTQCFEPGIAFRVWRGQLHTDVCVCFLCSGVDVTTEDAKHKVLHYTHSGLRYSRPAFLALSRQAFPEDKQLAALK